MRLPRKPNLPIVLLVGFSLSLIHTHHSRADEASDYDSKIEKHAFQAEVSRMMKLIINSLYTNKEIFLRELISNASDALDKIRALTFASNTTLDSLGELGIRIRPDEARQALHIHDTGIGMNRAELITNLGTIAKSGTSEFLKKSLENPDQVQLNDLIGQFGVGFYSSFLVANKVKFRTRSHHEPHLEHVWESDSTEFTVKVANEDDRVDGIGELQRGSVVTLYLKDEAKDFLNQRTLKELIKKYSQFINFPIYLYTSKTVTEEVPLDEEEEKKEKSEETTEKGEETTEEKSTTEGSEEDKVEDEEKKEDKKKTKKVEKTVYEWERINVANPIWRKNPKTVKEEEYNEFYKSMTGDNQPPLARIHFTAEGELTFNSLLFVPKTQPMESFNKYGAKADNIKLYVRRVFISDEVSELMSSYLNFVRGVVDSDYLPLNVGRETLQQHNLLKVIKRRLTRKALDMINTIDEDKYIDFWKEYSTNLKLGLIEDTANRNRIAKLLRFHSSKTGADGWTSLAEYVKNMQPDQKQILYVAGSSFNELSQSPFVEKVLKKGYEVLYLTDAVDEYAMSNLPEFENKKFQNIAKEGLELGKTPKTEEYKKALENKFAKLVSWFQKTALKDKVHKVVLSERLSESPAALVATAFGWSGNMERLAKSNAHSKSKDVTRDFYLQQKKILEINPYHPITKELLKRVEDDENDEQSKEIANVLFATATLRSGYTLQNTEDFAKKIERYMRADLAIPLDAPVEEEEFDVSSAESEPSADEDQKDADRQDSTDTVDKELNDADDQELKDDKPREDL